jgi:hypothetical protein
VPLQSPFYSYFQSRKLVLGSIVLLALIKCRTGLAKMFMKLGLPALVCITDNTTVKSNSDYGYAGRVRKAIHHLPSFSKRRHYEGENCV